MKQNLSRAEARRMALAAQGFARTRSGAPGTRQLNTAMGHMRVLQIDSVNVFARSHYMPFLARLGPYDTAALDRLLFARRAPYVESWAHVASFIPAADWGLFRFRMDDFLARYSRPGEWMASNPRMLEWVRAELGARGPLRPAQIESDTQRGKRGPWWDWDGVKLALEYLWLTGEVAIAGRRGFERVYGLARDVIPASVLQAPVSRPDAMRELVLRAIRAYGVATESDIDDYWRLRNRTAVKAAISDLTDAGEIEPVVVRGWSRGDRPLPAWVHRDAALPRRVDAAGILTPFDPMVWFRDRAERLFDFEYRIEIYTPAHKRRFGYYSLPVLVGDDVVGRVDLKADRARSTLLVQSAWWEPGAPPGAAERLATLLTDAAAWQSLESISISSWGDATDDLAKVLPRAARHDAGPDSTSDAPPALAPEEPGGLAEVDPAFEPRPA